MKNESRTLTGRNEAIYNYYKTYKHRTTLGEVGKLFPAADGSPLSKTRVWFIIQRIDRLRKLDKEAEAKGG